MLAFNLIFLEFAFVKWSIVNQLDWCCATEYPTPYPWQEDIWVKHLLSQLSLGIIKDKAIIFLIVHNIRACMYITYLVICKLSPNSLELAWNKPYWLSL